MGVEASARTQAGEEPRSGKQQALIERLLETFAAEDYEPPLLPGAALQLLSLARDPDIATSRIIALLETEPLIVARVIGAVQSPIYSAGARIRTIEDAVMRLGMRTIALLFAEAAMNAAMFTSPTFQAPMQALLRHSTATAHIARKLAERIGQPGDRVYLCGLLHDIGIAACLLVAPELTDAEGRSFEFEELADPIHSVHEQAGEMLGSLWNIPAGLRWVFAHHHSFTLRTHASPMAALVCLSSWIAGEAGAAAINRNDREQATLAAGQFGWSGQLPDLVTLGEGLVAELGRGEV
jgi:putative nucleotidyltransferase with HDIG domain